jgi:protein CpxP
MKQSGIRFNFANLQFIRVAVLAAALVFVPGTVFANAKIAHEDRAELRIKDMHTKLKITSAQEDQWGKVAEVMRDNGKTMDTLTQARVDHAKDTNAIDDLKSYGDIAEAHADGIKNLTPLFADLYASMSDVQKKEADTLFRHGYHKHGGHKHNHKKTSSK